MQPDNRLDHELSAPAHRSLLCPCSESPAGGTLHEVPKDPVTSENAECGVFVFVQRYAARSGRMSGSVDELWTGSWGIGAGEAGKRTSPLDRAPRAWDGQVPLQPARQPMSLIS
ncbi:hypothetical protein GCM10010121_086300 [Streptomyces brasiliensis]|uniref:Uncharacterized protein n=1 Tax=Streptomyces brasiliensis TaxID=1954 RepID=A0A917UJL1_9ACTN|nr:hypothetical protein GCM10010121_086300 [Streptomyces brasiliensis]